MKASSLEHPPHSPHHPEPTPTFLKMQKLRTERHNCYLVCVCVCVCVCLSHRKGGNIHKFFQNERMKFSANKTNDFQMHIVCSASVSKGISFWNEGIIQNNLTQSQV